VNRLIIFEADAIARAAADPPLRGSSAAFPCIVGKYVRMTTTGQAEETRSDGDGATEEIRPSVRAWVPLLGIIVLFVALSSFIAFKTPAWEAQDEPGHVANIESLVSGHWYGFNADCHPKRAILSCSGDEAQQAPLYYLLLAGWQVVTGQHAEPVPVHDLTFTRDNAQRSEFLVTHPDSGLVRWLRVPNIAMGAGTVIIAFLIIRRLADDRWTPLVGAATLAFLPRFIFLAPFVTNDNLVVLLGSVLTYCAIRFVQQPSTRWMLTTGAVLGLLVTTKLSVLPLLLLIPVLAAFAPSWRQRALQFGWGSLATAAVCSWYLIQNSVRYGDPLARSATTKYLTAIGALGVSIGKPYVVSNPANLVLNLVPKRLVTSFWYSSGWGQFHWSAGVGFLVTFAVLALLVGLIHQHIPVRVLVVLGSIAALSLASVWLLAFQTATAYGARYAYIGIAAIVAIVALSIQRWPVLLRWLLPAACLIGTLLAIHSDVLEIHWT
jgi:hypothetical protein